MMTDQHIPTDDEIRIAIVRALADVQAQAQSTVQYIDTISARGAGSQAYAETLASHVDNATIVSNAKEIIEYTYRMSHQYVTTIIAGAFAAYFATLGALSSRFSDNELRVSALLMTMALTIFVLWEVGNMSVVGYWALRGTLGTQVAMPRWQRIGWPLALAASLLLALPAIGLSVHVYLRGLGAYTWLCEVSSLHILLGW